MFKIGQKVKCVYLESKIMPGSDYNTYTKEGSYMKLGDIVTVVERPSFWDCVPYEENGRRRFYYQGKNQAFRAWEDCFEICEVENGVVKDEFKKYDLFTERYREYDFGGRSYRIDNPSVLYIKLSGTTHRIVDSEGVVHCVPAPGINGCVLRWKSKDSSVPVNF